jgi:hypothetical protein
MVARFLNPRENETREIARLFRAVCSRDCFWNRQKATSAMRKMNLRSALENQWIPLRPVSAAGRLGLMSALGQKQTFPTFSNGGREQLPGSLYRALARFECYPASDSPWS